IGTGHERLLAGEYLEGRPRRRRRARLIGIVHARLHCTRVSRYPRLATLQDARCSAPRRICYPDLAEWLALRSEIRELETLAKSTGVFAAVPRGAAVQGGK